MSSLSIRFRDGVEAEGRDHSYMSIHPRTGLISSAAASANSMSRASMAGLIRGLTRRRGFMRPVPVWCPGCSCQMAEEDNRRFFAYHPQTERRLGPRALRMTASLLLRTSGTPYQPVVDAQIERTHQLFLNHRFLSKAAVRHRLSSRRSCSLVWVSFNAPPAHQSIILGP